MAAPEKAPTLRCTICQAEVTPDTYASHIQSKHSSPPEKQEQTVASNEPQNQWTGSTDEIIVPTLSSEFWSVGTKISGKLDGYRETSFRDNSGATRNGIAYRLILDNSVTVNGELETVVEIPPLTGIIAAFKALKLKGYSPEKGDSWSIKCTEIRKAKRQGFSDSPNFTVSASREKF